MFISTVFFTLTSSCRVLKAQNQQLQEQKDLFAHDMQQRELELKYLDDRCGCVRGIRHGVCIV